MRNYLLISTLCLTVFTLGCRAQIISKTITLSYDATDFTFDTEEGFTIIGSDAHNIYYASDTLQPALPHITVNVLIEPTQIMLAFGQQINTLLVSHDITIPPNTIEIPDTIENDIPDTYANVTFYGTYPSSNIQYIGENRIDGAKILVFDVCPFQYNSSTNDLFIISNMEIEIMLMDYPTRGDNTSYLNNMYSLVENIVVNPEELTDPSSAYVKPQHGLYPPLTNTEGYEYVIVTTNAMKSEFQRLADWKTQKGVKAKVLTTEYIDSAYSQYSTQQLRIKHALRNYYDGQYKNLKYVLLGGSHSCVPSQLCYIHYLIDHDHTPSDYFYSCFDTMDWDTNHNGEVGEVPDQVDIYPEIFVTRLPARNTTDARIMVDKIIGYETAPNLSAWQNRLLMGGTELRKTKNGMSDSEYRSNRIFNNYINPYWNGARVRFFDTGTDFPDGANYQFNSYNLKYVLSQGYPFVNIYTHGNYDHWKMEVGDFTNTNIDEISNPIYSIITTNSCTTNGFDKSDTCFSNKFLQTSNSGVVAYWGSSRSEFSRIMYKKLGTCNTFIGEFYKQLFLSSHKQFGHAITSARIQHLSECFNPNLYSSRWTLFTFNALGDPEMPVYTQVPYMLDNAYVHTSNNTIFVSPTCFGCNICVMSKNDHGEQYYAVARGASNYYFQIGDTPATEFVVTISKANYIPRVIEVSKPDTIYIQNEIFLTDSMVSADNVFIGKDVTTTKPTGEVSVNSGTLTIRGRKKVYIKNGFKVNHGAQLRILHP